MEGRSAARRLHSITGLVPVGAFLVFHLWTNTASARGADAYDAAARRLQELPFSLAAEILLIGLPLVFHGVYGLYLSAATDPGSPRPTRARVALSRLQRATGAVVFAFLFFHLWTARLVQVRDHSSVDLFRLIQAALASRWITALYAAGILAAIVHLAAGVWTSAETWGLLRTRAARAATAAAAAAVFAVLSIWSVVALKGFALRP
jgi:succinate dehydrogenase / fumarate reductase, cytochrome b subunit